MTTQYSALFELSGVACRFELDYEFQSKVAPEQPGKFKQSLFNDVGVSIADCVPDVLRVRASETQRSSLSDCLVWGSQGIRVVSDALKAIIERYCVPNTEFFAVEIILNTPLAPRDEWAEGERLGGYWLMNCWNKVDVVDFDASDLEWVGSPLVKGSKPYVNAWKRLVFKSEIAADLFGLAGAAPTRRFVSPSLKNAIESAGLNAGIYAQPTKIEMKR